MGGSGEEQNDEVDPEEIQPEPAVESELPESHEGTPNPLCRAKTGLPAEIEEEGSGSQQPDEVIADEENENPEKSDEQDEDSESGDNIGEAM